LLLLRIDRIGHAVVPILRSSRTPRNWFAPFVELDTKQSAAVRGARADVQAPPVPLCYVVRHTKLPLGCRARSPPRARTTAAYADHSTALRNHGALRAAEQRGVSLSRTTTPRRNFAAWTRCARGQRQALTCGADSLPAVDGMPFSQQSRRLVKLRRGSRRRCDKRQCVGIAGATGSSLLVLGLVIFILVYWSQIRNEETSSGERGVQFSADRRVCD
jgi:hypothetical protein